MASLETLEATLRFTFKSLNGQIADLSRSLYRTRRYLIALAGLLSQKGISIDPDEWEAAGKELDAAHAVEKALDPRLDKAEERLRRLMTGEVIPEDELSQWLRDVGEGGA